MRHTASVCSKCSVGCNVDLWQRRGELMRVTSRENDDIDDGWICDRGRFDYVDVERPRPACARPPSRAPRQAGMRPLATVAAGIKGKGAKLGISLPQDLTNEEGFLFRRLLDGPLKGAQVEDDGRTALAAPQPDQLLIREIDGLKAIVVVASDLREDAPIVNLRVKKAVRRGAKLLTLNPEPSRLRSQRRRPPHRRPNAGKAADAVRDLPATTPLKEGPVGDPLRRRPRWRGRRGGGGRACPRAGREGDAAVPGDQ